MKRSVLSWYTALANLPASATPAVRKLRTKIELATNNQPMSEMIDIPTTAVETDLVNQAIRDSVGKNHGDERSTIPRP